MTFLEALNWMSESEENIAVRSNGEYYKLSKTKTLLQSNNGVSWYSSVDTLKELMDFKWSKSEPAPEEVDINGYIKPNGEMCFALKDSEADKNYSIDGDWRKVKVRFS